MKKRSCRETRYQESTSLKFVDIKLWEEIKKESHWDRYYRAYPSQFSFASPNEYTMQDAPPPYSYTCPTASEALTCNVDPLKES